MIRKYMTKKEAVSDFIEYYLPYIPVGDKPALAESWNNYTDIMCKEGKITQKQYNTWTHPYITSHMWKEASLRENNQYTH